MEHCVDRIVYIIMFINKRRVYCMKIEGSLREGVKKPSHGIRPLGSGKFFTSSCPLRGCGGPGGG